MRTTSIDHHLIQQDVNDSKALQQIKSWIDANMILNKEGTIWRAGLASTEEILEIKGKLMKDLECKHLRSWRVNSFKEAVKTLSSLCKYPFVFKSPYHDYLQKGQYVFVYKIPSPYMKHFYHVLHS